MITNFEDITYELTPHEEESVKFIKEILENADGCPVTASAICDVLRNTPTKFNFCGARIRKIINYMRVKKVLTGIVAGQKGYYLTDDPKVIEKYVKSLQERINSIMDVKNSFTVL